jgi:antitoxin YefM
MQVTTVSNFRKNLKSYLDDVVNNSEKLVVSKGKDNAVIVLSLDDFNAMEATLHEIKNADNKKRLDSAIAKIENGLTYEKELIEE